MTFIILIMILLRKCNKNVTNCRAGLESPAHLVYDNKSRGLFLRYAPVAQLDRALASDARCRWFESSQVH